MQEATSAASASTYKFIEPNYSTSIEDEAPKEDNS